MKRFIAGLMFCLLTVVGLTFGGSSSPPYQNDDNICYEVPIAAQDQEVVQGEGFIIYRNAEYSIPGTESGDTKEASNTSSPIIDNKSLTTSASPICLHIDPGLNKRLNLLTYSLNKGHSFNLSYDQILNSKAYLCSFNSNC
jgi:hypothetical protein